MLDLALLLAAAAVQVDPGATGQSGTEAWQAPTLTIVRYDEHWDRLAAPEARDDHWTEPFKYIPIGDDGAYLTTGLELRARREAYHDNLLGNAAAPDDAYVWLRALPYADLHVGRVRGFVQPIAAYAIGVAPSAGPIDQTRLDLLQGFADIRLGPAETGASNAPGVTLRAGRQMLSFGSERLIGTRYGPNVPLAFDGGRAILSLPGARIDLLAVRPVQPGPHSFDDRRSTTKSLWGAYATMPWGQNGLDLYYLGYRNRLARFGGMTGSERRHSLGVRHYGAAGPWHWNIEGVVQFGRFADRSIRAWTVATELGYRFPTAPLSPDLVLRFNMVSGDAHAGDGQLGTFNALFPKGKYFGELSPIGPSNIVNVNPRASFVLGHGVSASVAAMAYWRQSLGDGVYDIPGNLIRAPGTATARFIGKQAEVALAWQVTPELELSTSLSAFVPGGFLRQTGPARTTGLWGLEANFRF
ncbi:alginate export family protein [Sphingomonas fuzhouensis]|uniref:alginate export family protein n=1 Tax=Sphingomonas fuzhouensis TaxID=3106033 RepID=UPI002AFECAAD|nr:alginate export family protein [Sphingomonas sp. SGZ-02]